ncbi:MAG: carotenoid 1,2-hydratase [Candidatus Poribacteria bacterium]|nr:carotenoid 1,2-hydratase [Candidatus Poribacteria bacterium]
MFRLVSIFGGVVVIATVISITAKQVEVQMTATDSADAFMQLLQRPDKSIGFPKNADPRIFSFPADHGPHLDNRLEWWYYTGNLETQSGRHFGYQLTFFRLALTPKPAQRESKWATNQTYMAHFALTDVEQKSFHAFERKSRGAVGLAGAQSQPFEVWVDSWSAVDGSQPPKIIPGIARTEGTFMYLSAAEGDIAINLLLEGGKPVVLQGDNGRAQKSAEADAVSYYYSLTRMPTTGTIGIDGKTFQVKGLSWLDREWGSGLMGKDQVGWSWFALQLSDAREIMFGTLRERDSRVSPFSRGVLVHGDGEVRALTLSDIQIDALDYWQSPKTQIRYPSRWRMHIPSEQVMLVIEPYLADQELNLSMGGYWEGAVKVTGTSRGKPVGGNGYVELTGFRASH